MILQRYHQQPSENLRRQLDYSRWLASAETLSTVDFTIEETRPEGSDPATNPFTVSNSGFDPETQTKLIFFAGGSITGSQVLLTIKVTTSAAQVKEDEIVYAITEVP